MKNLKYFPFERNQYFYGKLLSVDDFQTEQKYMNDKRRLINRFLHGCGVVCGLNVVQVDDCTLSLETGLALDFAGREIVVDAPVTRKLSMIEGFDAYTEEDEDSSYLYLCIEYAERDKDPVYNVTGSASREAEYNKVAEGYHLYVTNREPEGGSVSGRSYMEEQKVIYWGNGIRISQVFPRFAESGKEFPFTVVVENMGQKLPIQFSYELQLECLEHGGESRIRISFDENDFEKSRRYEVPCFLTASDVKKRQGKARLEKGSFQLGIGGHSLELDAECVITVQIEREDAGRVLSGRYYREAMEEILKDTYHQSIYLAKISVIQAGTTFVIDGIEQMPFQQYVYSEVLAGMMNRVLEEKVERLERRLASRPQADRDAGTPGSGLLPDVPQAATGSVVLDLGIGGTAGQKFFSGEITHGLGLGNVRIVLGEACGVKEEAGAIYGAADIFDETMRPVRAEIAAKTDAKKGTFVIGLRLLETTTTRQVKIHWMALKDRKESLYDREERELFVKPDMIYLKLRESYYFEAVFTGAADKRVTWKVKEAEGGTIDANGMYTAPNVPGIFEVIAESAAYPGLTASAFVVVKE